MSTTVDIPIAAGQQIAEAYGYDQVVIVARKVGGREHVTTYGIDKAHCGVAARMGDFFKHKLMGWPRPEDQQIPLTAAQVVTAIYSVDTEAARRGEMFPQTSDEQQEDRRAVSRVVNMLQWYEKNTGCARLNGWPGI